MEVVTDTKGDYGDYQSALSGPMALPCRETPLHQLYSSAFSKQKLQDSSTKMAALPFGDLPPGYQHLHTQLQYECFSPFYRRLGSSRRTCLKTGKWSGRAPSCTPSESKLDIGLEEITSMASEEQSFILLKAFVVKVSCSNGPLMLSLHWRYLKFQLEIPSSDFHPREMKSLHLR